MCRQTDRRQAECSAVRWAGVLEQDVCDSLLGSMGHGRAVGGQDRARQDRDRTVTVTGEKSR